MPNSSKHTCPSRGPSVADAGHVDRLITFREVNTLIGSRCQTGHAARSLAAKGLIRAVRLSPKTVRYSEQSVNALIQGKDAMVR